MKLYPEEWECAQEFQRSQQVPCFSQSQLGEIREIGRRYTHWCQSHPYLHNALNVCVLCALFLADLVILIVLPTWLIESRESWWVALLAVGGLHGFIFYSVSVFSMHEGAAHNRIIQQCGPISRWLAHFANNMCRVFYADPIYYRSRHIHHHASFGTQQDGAFTNFVWPRRFFVSLLPFAGVLDFNDYRIHTDTKYSWSRIASVLIGTGYLLGVGAVMAVGSGVSFAVLVLLIISPWVAFLLDRLRETTEHNLMALDTENGTRNLGLGFWGLLVGGGPWGQPCHLSHHLIPALPWYQQCLLHRRLRRIMTAEQRRYFCIAPIVGYPRLLAHVLNINLTYAKAHATGRGRREIAGNSRE